MIKRLQGILAGILVGLVLAPGAALAHNPHWGSWRHAPSRLVGQTVDLVDGGYRRINSKALIYYGDTTFIIFPNGDVGTS